MTKDLPPLPSRRAWASWCAWAAFAIALVPVFGFVVLFVRDSF